MYDQYPIHDVPQRNFVQRFFSQRWSAIALEIVMTIVITVAAGAAFDFFDPLEDGRAAPAESAPVVAGAVETADREAWDSLEWIMERGKGYLGEGRLAAAEAMFDWAIALAPDDIESYSWRGYVKMQAGEYAAAQFDYRKLLEANPRDFEANSALCWAYGETGQFSRAKRHCRLAIEIAFNRAEFAIALENWCWLQVEMGEYAEAAQDCRFALEYAPEYQEVQALANYNMGRVLLAQGRMSEALPHLQEALRLGSSYARMYLEIGEIYDKLGYGSLAGAAYARYRQMADGSAARAQG